MIFYRCVTGDHTGNYYILTSCLSVTSPSRIVVLGCQTKHDSFSRNSPISTVLTVECFFAVILSICRFKRVNFLFENVVVESKTYNSFIQKDCVIFYRCVTGDQTGNYYIITSCLSVTSPSRTVVLKLSNKA